MNETNWIWIVQFLLSIILGAATLWIKSIYSDIRILDKEFDTMQTTMYREYATKSDVNKLEQKIENLGNKIEVMPERIMVKIEKLLDKKP